MTDSDLINAYRAQRRASLNASPASRPRPSDAASCLARARLNVAEGKTALHDEGKTYGWSGGTPDPQGLQHFPDLESAGLRFVGYADELARLDHTGWYSDASQDAMMRGVVVQLPARGGCAQYLAGYEDAYGNGYILAVPRRGAIFQGEKGGAGEYEAKSSGDAREAARRADRIAEREAEEARDYDEAWQAGARYADEAETLAATRKEALAILAERRKVAAVEAPALCKAIRDQLRAILATRSAAFAKRESLARDVYGDTCRRAFNEGAGEPVLSLA